MLFKITSAAIVAAVVGTFAAQAQTLAQIGGPAEMPPAGYKGAQFIDSRGCVFMNASFSGGAQWVPRVNRNHKVMCGLQPTFGPRSALASIDVAADNPVAAPVAPAPKGAAAAPVMAAAAPMRTVASNMMPEAAPLAVPVVRAAPVAVARVAALPVAALPVAAQTYEAVAANGPSAGQIGCYTSAPVAEVVRLRNGGTAVVCTRGDGSLTGWRPPIYPSGSRVGASLSEPVLVAGGHASHAGASAVPRYAAAEVSNAAANAQPVIPAGYKAAWKDGRLNTQRGVTTAQGNADQDAIWTKKVPAQLIADVAKKKAYRKKQRGVTVSTMNAPAAVGASFVQVGTFGVPANAAGAAQRLAALGLPVTKSVLHKGGKDLQIVLAGPFGSAAEAQAALGMARQAGFGDAILR